MYEYSQPFSKQPRFVSGMAVIGVTGCVVYEAEEEVRNIFSSPRALKRHDAEVRQEISKQDATHITISHQLKSQKQHPGAAIRDEDLATEPRQSTRMTYTST